MQTKNLPPPPATGSIQKITWLGLPKDGHLFAVSTFYCRPEVRILAEAHENIICGPLEVRLFYKKMHFYVICAERVLLPEEIESPNQDYKKIEFEGNLPNALELIKVSKTFKGGPSAIVIDGFNVTNK